MWSVVGSIPNGVMNVVIGAMQGLAAISEGSWKLRIIGLDIQIEII